MKLVLKTEGLEGENLEFVKGLNKKFDEIDLPTAEDVLSAVKKQSKSMWDEEGNLRVDFDKLAETYEKSFGEGENSLKSILKRQGEVITSLKELGASGNNRIKSIREELKTFFNDPVNKAKIQQFKRGEIKAFGAEVNTTNGQMMAGIQLKAASTMTVASNDTQFVPGVQVLPGLVELTRNRPFIESFANVSTTNRPRLVWTEKYNPQGQAAFIGEGTVKPLISFGWRIRESYAKKVADKIKVSTEALDDIDWMAAEIETELKYQVDIRVDISLLTGVGDGTNTATDLQGLVSAIGGFVLTAVNTKVPNNFDVGRASYAQIVSLNFTPTHWFINPIDSANMDLVKDANGRPLAVEYRDPTGKIIKLIPVETNQISVGYFLMGDMTRFKIANYQPFSIYYGWVNDDFEKNLVTIIGERRLHAYVASNDFGAFVYAKFADVKTAITAV